MPKIQKSKKRVSKPYSKVPLLASQRVSRFVPSCYGFPDRLQTTLRYHFCGAVNSVAGATGKQVFRWNSAYDPDVTNVGHQPMFRDTFATIYDQYAVISARAEIRFINPNSTSFLVGAVTDDDLNSATSTDALCEQNHGKRALLTPLTGSKSEEMIRMNWTCKDILGIDPYTSQTYKTAIGSDPSEVSTLVLWAADLTGATNGVLVDVSLEMDVLFTELQTQVLS